MPAKMKATINQLRVAHAELRSIYKVAALFDMCPQSVHERLRKSGYDEWKNRPWSGEENAVLLKDYHRAANACELDGLAAKMGRTKQFICRKAKDVGLTNPNRSKAALSVSMSERFKDWNANNPHPRGMLGKNHSADARSRIANGQKSRWDNMTTVERDAHWQKQISGRIAAGDRPPQINQDSKKTWKSDWRNVGPQRCYFRSSWEANYARYLQWLVERGQIKSWEHEPYTFWFDGIRRGVCSYKPDFRVVENNGVIVWHEVKGWMDDRSRVTLKRMSKYFPDETIILIDGKAYKSIQRKIGYTLPGWE